MANKELTSAPAAEDGNRWLTVIASQAMGAAFFSLWIWLLPKWLGFSAEAAGAARWRWLAAVPSVLGFAVALRCIWDFGWTGRGTPAPFAPPQRLVAVGVYRHVRNPMYLGFAINAVVGACLGRRQNLKPIWFSSQRADLVRNFPRIGFPAKRNFYCNAMKSKDKELSGPTDMGHKHLVVEPGALQIFL
jgi:hypothetical protein